MAARELLASSLRHETRNHDIKVISIQCEPDMSEVEEKLLEINDNFEKKFLSVLCHSIRKDEKRTKELMFHFVNKSLRMTRPSHVCILNIFLDFF